jgi:acyl-CoA reductase-like NAD-dependent aldehyde dehydrogenase
MGNLSLFNPWNRQLIASLPFHTESDLEHALETGHTLFETKRERLEPFRRIEILKSFSTLVEQNEESLLFTAIEEGGKPLQDSRLEFSRALNGIQLAIGEIVQWGGSSLPMGLTNASTGRIAFTQREPIGLVVAISAFNHPINLIIHQVITALAAGCPVIVKPSLKTPLTCLSLANLLYEAGLPKDWLHVLLLPDHLTAKLAGDIRVKFLNFIGSAKVGWKLKSQLAPGTRCALEHGGIAPVIVGPDAPLGEIAPALIKSGFYHAGQVCVSTQRIYIHESLAEKFCTHLKTLTENLITGDPQIESTQIGPIISEDAIARIDKAVQDALKEGARLVTGGYKINDTLYAPTLLWNPPSYSSISKEEVFGPVIALYPYRNLGEALESANKSPYPFQAGVFSQDIDFVLRAANELKASSVMINDTPAFRTDWMPFGGREQAGEGVGGIGYAMREMSQEKLWVIKSKSL